MAEYHKGKVPKNEKMGTKHPYGKHADIMPKKIPQSLTPGKDTGGSAQRPIKQPYGKKVAGTNTSREFNKGPISMGTGRWKSGSKTFGRDK